MEQENYRTKPFKQMKKEDCRRKKAASARARLRPDREGGRTAKAIKISIVRGGLSGNLFVLCRRDFPGVEDNGLKFLSRWMGSGHNNIK